MIRISLPETAHRLIGRRLNPGNFAIDATLGNGHDMLFLAQQVAPTGRVFGFDIQPAAIEATAARLAEAGLSDCATLLQASHADMGSLIPEKYHGRIRAVMFNLGYLPGGDKTVITQTASTLVALDAARNLLAPAGAMTILAYPGHAGGDSESEKVRQWLENLDASAYRCEVYHGDTDNAEAPRLFYLEYRG